MLRRNDYGRSNEYAFGLVALNTMVIVEDGEGGTDAIEAAIAELEDVASVEVTATGRLM